MKFKVDDLVRLKSGGPQMIITGFGYSIVDKASSTADESSPIYCEWYEGIVPRQRIYIEDDLELVNNSS
ncbi:YodC family protein [Spirosoma pollinicola]|uniref:DUF2158 domain-containing protein n=1 Tax=Spirosoma pollinicola TaxID=2057025 RepID=A0A2K8Z2P3_9BACT|nr:hypothetical protein CWM47_21330 [Spirosoma pollinicola]